jgi:membrane protease YdiL (CAAX protease family)
MSNASSEQDSRHSHKGITWNPWLGLFFAIFIFFFGQILAALVVSLYPAALGWSEDRTERWFDETATSNFAYFMATAIIMVGALHIFLKSTGSTWRAIGMRRPRLSDAAYGLAAVPFYMGLYLLTVAVISFFVPGLDIQQEQQLGFNGTYAGFELVLVFLSLVILPPLVEEILIRGFLYSSLKKALPILSAAVTTSLIFAIAHLPEGGEVGPLYIAAIDTFVLSLVLIYLREKTGGLWASMTLHGLKNGFAFVLLFILKVG